VIAYCAVVLLLTFTLRGSVGFGGSIGMPLFALVLPVKVLAPAWSLIGILSSAAILGKDRKLVDRKAFLGLLPGCALGVAIGLFLFTTFDARLLARLLGGFVILYSAWCFWRLYHPAGAAKFVPPVVLRTLGSFLSGAVGTLFGAMASVFFSLYLDGCGATKSVYRATISAMLFTLSIVRTAAYVAAGEFTIDALMFCGAAIPFMLLGLLVGDKIHTGLTERAFQYIVAITLLVCGLPLLLKP